MMVEFIEASGFHPLLPKVGCRETNIVNRTKTPNAGTLYFYSEIAVHPLISDNSSFRLTTR